MEHENIQTNKILTSVTKPTRSPNERKNISHGFSNQTISIVDYIELFYLPIIKSRVI